MTARRNLKRRVRARAAKTGESYTAALRHFRPTPTGEVVADNNTSTPPPLRLAVAQCTVREDPGDADGLRASGAEIRALMGEAAAAGARLVCFPEGATCFPGKRIMATDPERQGPADWSRAAWDVLAGELAAIAALAGELRLWTVLGSVHRLTPPNRPHNSLYVLDDRGRVATRYDDRMLSHTKATRLYAPGTAARTVTVDGLRFGLTIGLEVHFPELFAEYERLDVDAVLFATTGGLPGDGGVFAASLRAHAAVNGYWAGFAVPAGYSGTAPAGIVSPAGNWVATAPADGRPALVVADLAAGDDSDEVARTLARPWRRRVRAEGYQPVADPRSDELTAF
jgi:predicted amidohydrolase